MKSFTRAALLAAIAISPMSAAHAQEAPRIFAGSNGELEATFDNNCVVYYRSDGYRRDANSNCSSGQIASADVGVRSYRREQGMDGYAGSEAPPGGYGNNGHHFGPPEVVMDGHGCGHVLVGPSCIVYYGRDGDRDDTNDMCSRSERSDADKAMASFRREQGLTQEKRSGFAYGLPVLRLRNGNYQVTTGGGCTVYFNDRGGLMTSMPACDAGDRAKAATAVLLFRRENN